MAKTPRTIRVRKAEPKDVVAICKLLKNNGWHGPLLEIAPIDEIRGYRWMLNILERGMAAVADLDGRIVGAACVSPYVPAWAATDCWMLDLEILFVHPAFRREAVADRLIKAVEGFADRHGLPLTFSIETDDRPEVKNRMMRMAGWTQVGGTFFRPAGKKLIEDGEEDQAATDDAVEEHV